MNRRDVVQHAQHIASLGLPPHVAIGEILTLMKLAVPAAQMSFFWTDPQGRPIDMWVETFIPGALESSLALMATDVLPSEPCFWNILRGPREFNNCEVAERSPDWERSALKNDMYRGYGIATTFDVILRDRGVLRGGFGISREAGAPRIAAAELKALMAVRPHLLHAMDGLPRQGFAADLNQADFPAHIVCALDGSVLLLGPGGEDALFRLCDDRIDRGVSVVDRVKRIPSAAMIVLERLRNIRSGQLGSPAKADVSTRFGRFQVAAHPMTDGQGVATDQILITVQQLIRRDLRSMRKLRETALTGAERRVALAMLDPGDGNAVADRLGLSPGSYRQYAKRVYAALGVEGRIGLKSLLDT